MNLSKITPNNTFLNLPQQKRNRILDVAAKEFAAKGYQRASLNTIIKQLGISKGSIYQYFKNKEALFLYVFDCLTSLVKETVKKSISLKTGATFMEQINQVLWSGIRFIDNNPEYFQIYLKILFEQDVPHREELIAKVRLFSLEYFGPLCDLAKKQGHIRNDLPTPLVIFIIDATMDRFLQGYASPYLDSGLGLASKDQTELKQEVDTIIKVLKDGLSPSFKGDNNG